MLKSLFITLLLGSLSLAYGFEDKPASSVDDGQAKDAALGKSLSEQVDKEYKASKNTEYQERVSRIGAEIAKIANESTVNILWGSKKACKFNYTFKVLVGDDVNAFSLPGGYIYVFEGLINHAESDDELAGVIAHEVSHAAFRHLATLEKEKSKIDAVTIPMILIAIISGGSTAGGLIELGQLVGVATGSGWSQKAEEAADYGGFQYMLKSKYNPTGMVTFMERLAFEERMSPKIDWGIYRTHPPTRERANELVQRMNTAGIAIKRSTVTTLFKTQIKPTPEGNFDAWFGGRKLYTFSGEDAQSRAEKAAARIDSFMDSLPELFDIRSLQDGTIIGHGTVLWQVTSSDAQATKDTLANATTNAVLSLKRSLYNLTYRVWDF
jgi:predicted Zn-dependent protease